jgi:hypothetical protein
VKGMVGGLIVYTVAAPEDALDDWAVNWGKVVYAVLNFDRWAIQCVAELRDAGNGGTSGGVCGCSSQSPMPTHSGI